MLIATASRLLGVYQINQDFTGGGSNNVWDPGKRYPWVNVHTVLHAHLYKCLLWSCLSIPSCNGIHSNGGYYSVILQASFEPLCNSNSSARSIPKRFACVVLALAWSPIFIYIFSCKSRLLWHNWGTYFIETWIRYTQWPSFPC